VTHRRSDALEGEHVRREAPLSKGRLIKDFEERARNVHTDIFGVLAIANSGTES